MQLPIIEPAPIVLEHARAFRDLFENHCQFDHFRNYLTGLMVLENKSLSNISRCILESADKTNLSRFLSQAPWSEKEVNTRRVEYMKQQTQLHQRSSSESFLVIDDTLCEHVGSLFEYVDRHYDHSENRYPLAHNLVTSHFVSGAVRFPIEARLYRRYEEKTQWETFVKKHFPQQSIPKESKARKKFHKQIDPFLLKEPEFAALDAQFQTKIALAIELIQDAITRKIPFETLLIDSWFLAPDILEMLERHHLHWVSLLKKNRNLETHSFTLKLDVPVFCT
jgi:SRSO17 transposase